VPKRRYQEVEARMLAEWLEAHSPPVPTYQNQPLGPPVGFGFTGVNPRVDALKILPDQVILIEGEVDNPSEAIGQLLIYRWLFRQTPKFSAHHDKPVRTILVVPRPIGILAEFCKLAEIEVHIQPSPWLTEYLLSGTMREAP